MASLENDDDSQGASSDNDADDTIEDPDEADADHVGEPDGDVENEEDNDENEDEDDLDEAIDESPMRSQPKFLVSRQPSSDRSSLPNGLWREQSQFSASKDPRLREDAAFNGPASPRPASNRGNTNMHLKPILRPETITALSYDIVPTIAAPHSTSINVVTATPDMRWVFSGGADGWIRKFNWIDTVNGKTMLTVAQRHPFVDSVTKAGMLMSYWENEETSYKSNALQSTDDSVSLSPVYSLAVHYQGLWLLSGTESGSINLQSVRHDEGRRITSLYKHTSAVSVLSLSQDETSVLSGSWDKTINDWDLNTGQVRRSYTGSGGQISAIEMRPTSDLPITQESLQRPIANGTLSSNNVSAPSRKGSLFNILKKAEAKNDAEDIQVSPHDSLFGGDGENDSLFGDNDTGAGNGGTFDDEDDEFSIAISNGIQQQERLDADGDLSMSEIAVPASAKLPLSPARDSSLSSLSPPVANGLSASQSNGVLDAEDANNSTNNVTPANNSSGPLMTSENVFLDAAIDGTLRIWDRRQPTPMARIVPAKKTPPWCMHACWSPDGNYIYAGRRNGTVDEYNIYKGLHEPLRTLKFPAGSGAVSSVRAMPNGRHLICASYDILRLYDLKDEESVKHSKVPFLIVPGHRTGVVSQLYIDPSCSFMVSVGGNRGWEGNSTEVLLGYEIGVGR